MARALFSLGSCIPSLAAGLIVGTVLAVAAIGLDMQPATAAEPAAAVPTPAPASAPAPTAAPAPGAPLITAPPTASPPAKFGEATESNPKAVAAASAEANHWMDQLNAGKFAQAWLDSAAPLQDAISQKDWIEGLTARHEKFGRLLMMKLDSANYTRTLPEAPRGEYVVARFLSKYEQTPALSETVLVAKDALGEWRVAGYDLEPADK